jgi:UDP:flavonoid glycosyltransferase YjiC (YdhE family)
MERALAMLATSKNPEPATASAGLDLRTGRPARTRYDGAVTRALHEPRLRQRAGELGATMITAGGVRTAGKLIEDLLARR